MDCNLLSFLKDDKEKTVNGFRAAGITETVNDAKNVIERVENSFMEDWCYIELSV